MDGRTAPSIESLIELYFTPEKGIWPVELSELKSRRDFVPFKPGKGDPLFVGKKTHIRVNTMPLIHKGGCSGYQILLPNHGPVVILTDHEPELTPDPNIVAWLEGAALAVLDMQYTDDEYAGEVLLGGMKRSRNGWGHGTPNRWFPHLLACQKPPKRVLITHHDPHRSDADLDAFWEKTRDMLRTAYGGSLPFDYQFARGGQIYWL